MYNLEELINELNILYDENPNSDVCLKLITYNSEGKVKTYVLRNIESVSIERDTKDNLETSNTTVYLNTLKAV